MVIFVASFSVLDLTSRITQSKSLWQGLSKIGVEGMNDLLHKNI